MKKGIAFLLVLMLSISMNIQQINATVSSSEIEAKVNELLSKMTIEQKVGQLIQADKRSINPADAAQYGIGSVFSGGGAAPDAGNKATDWADLTDSYQDAVIKATGIPILYGVDAVHGHNNVYGSTIFPHNIGLGAADDTDLVKRIASATAKEVRATGIQWTYTPTVGVPHNERWGRTYETFGDDYQRVSRLGKAYVEGSQQDISATTSAMATAKHFVGEGLTTNGTNQGEVTLSDSDYQDLLNADMSNPMVNEILTPYKASIDAGVKSVMVSYNSINGKKCHGNKELITGVLKGKLGFKGIVVSDYNGLDQIEGNLSYVQKAVQCFNAGVDMLMIDATEGNQPKWKVAYNGLVAAVKNNEITTERLNEGVSRILTVKFEMDLFDNNFAKAYAQRADLASVGGDEHRAIAREAVNESMVLLKNTKFNDDKTVMEALAKDMKNIVVAGVGADDMGIQCGGWTISWQGQTGKCTKGTTIFEGMNAAMKAKGGQATYSATGYFSDKTAEAAVVFVGETQPYAESNGDRAASQLKLTSADQQVIDTIKEEHPDLPIIMVMITGRPLGISQYVKDDSIDAIASAWYPGSEGQGVADVLLGDKDFVGKNPITWTWYPQDITNKSDPTKVLYPVGYGLNKSEVSDNKDAPVDPSIIDLSATGGQLEAEDFINVSGIQVSGNGKYLEYLDNGRYTTYKINVPEKASYTLSVNSAREYSETIKGAFEMYLDGVKVLKQSDTSIITSTAWDKFVEQDMVGKVSLLAGEHTLKFVSTAKDYNVDYFKFVKSGEYVEPEIDVPEENVGTGSLIKKEAVGVSMSSSEHSQDMSWYKGEYKIANKNSQKASLDLRTSDDSQITTINVNQNVTYQSLLGMGTSVEESTVNNLMKMGESERKAFIKRLVDPVNGNGMTLFRLTIGTSDFTSKKFYTYYDGNGKELNGAPDWNNTTGKGFSIQKDVDNHMIEIVEEILAAAEECGVKDQIKFFASSWTPPGWMKTETSSSKGYKNNELLLKGGKLNDDYINDLAKYYVRYLEEYAKLGIDIYAMTLQNEPMLEIDYPSCNMTAIQEANLAKAIKTEIGKSTVLNAQQKAIKVWAFDHNPDSLNSYMGTVYDNARDAVDGSAVHDYSGALSEMTKIHNTYTDKTVHLTERSVWGTYGMDRIVQYFRNYAESYNAWVTMLDSNISSHQWVGTPDPTMFVQDANNSNRYWSTPEVYLIGQFTKYLRPGFVRVDSNYGSSSTVTNVIFKNPETNEMAMIVVNQTDKDQPFKVVMDNTQFNATLPAKNVATYTWQAGDSEIKSYDAPGTIKASDCAAHSNLDVNEDNTLGNLKSNATADYFVNVKEAGVYNVLINVATGADNDKVIELLSEGNSLGKTLLRKFNTWDAGGAWGDYRPVQIQVKLEKGIQRITLSVPDGSVNIKDLIFKKTKENHNVPGYITATDYSGAEGVINEGGNVGFFDTTSDWSKIDRLVYKLNVQKAGTYKMKFLYATGNDVANFFVDTKNATDTDWVGDPVSAGHDMSTTGGFDKYQTSEGVDITLAEGINEIRITPSANKGFNLSGISFGPYVQLSTLNDVTLTEGQLNDKTIVVTLADGSFVSDFDASKVKVEGLPEGIDYEVQYKGANTLYIQLSGNETVDFDSNLDIKVSIDATLVGDADYQLTDSIAIQANDDAEVLSEIGTIAFGKTSMTLTLEGGMFNKDITKEDLVLSDSIAKYMEISSIDLKDSHTLDIKLTRLVTNYEDATGSITLKTSGFTDSIKNLESAIVLEATSELPTAEVVENNSPLQLTEDKAYRKQGTLAAGSHKGDYVDYFIDIKEAGNYSVSYNIKTSESISNALKLSGGEGLKTDNIGSVSFGKFWGNKLGYKQTLNLKAGKQTLRFEVNTEGFELTDLQIQKQSQSVPVGDTTKIDVGQLIDGSKENGWGIENKGGILNIGCGGANAYQDYRVHVEKAGTYTFMMNYSHSSGNTPKAILQLVPSQQASRSVKANEVTTLGSIDLPATGGWDTFKDSQTVTVHLDKGEQTLRLFDDVDGFNYRSFTLSLKEADVDYVATLTVSDADIELGTDLKYVNFAQLLNTVASDNKGNDLTSTVHYDVSQVDASKIGTYSVAVTLTGKDGVSIVKNVQITVKDTTAPTIDAQNATVKLGDKTKLEDIIHLTISDLSQYSYKIETDYDSSKEGVYNVKIIATDKYNNEIEKTVKVTVAKEIIITPEPGDGNHTQTPDKDVNDKVETSDQTALLMNSALAIMCLLGAVYCVIAKRKED